MRTRNGVPFRFTLLVYTEGRDHVQFSQVAQENLRELGIDMSIQRLDWQALLTRLRGGQFQAALVRGRPADARETADVMRKMSGAKIIED